MKDGQNEVIVGADSGLRLTMERVEMVSRSDVPVLIIGETGSGKEVIARAVHSRSERVTGPSAGALPDLRTSERGGSNEPTEAPCSWMRSASCR